MKKSFIGLLLLCSTATAQGGTVRSLASGLTLLSACTSEMDAAASLCNGYLTGLIDAEHLQPGRRPLCLPRPVRVHSAREAFVTWGESHPEDLDRAAAAVVREALEARWPCEKRAS